VSAAQAAFSAFRMLAGGGKGFAGSRAPRQQPITAAEAAAAEAQAQHRQARNGHILVLHYSKPYQNLDLFSHVSAGSNVAAV